MLFAASLFAGVSPYVIITDPAAPTAGQKVTFTLFEDDHTGTTDQTAAAGAFGFTLDPGDGSEPIVGTFTDNGAEEFCHTYESSGEFTIALFAGESPFSFRFNGAVTDGPTAMFTIAPAAAAAPIPTLGEWSLIIMSIILIVVGLVYVKQRDLVSNRL